MKREPTQLAARRKPKSCLRHKCIDHMFQEDTCDAKMVSLTLVLSKKGNHHFIPYSCTKILSQIHGSTTVHEINIIKAMPRMMTMGVEAFRMVTVCRRNCMTLLTRHNFDQRQDTRSSCPRMKNHGVKVHATLSCSVVHPDPSSNESVRIEVDMIMDEAQINWRKNGCPPLTALTLRYTQIPATHARLKVQVIAMKVKPRARTQLDK